MKQNTNKYLAFGVCLAFVLYLTILLLTPTPINWELSFSKDDNIPYGTKILFEEMGQLFPDEKIQTSHTPVYNFFDEIPLDSTNLIIINNTFKPDTFDCAKLYEMALKGSNIFIAASRISQEFKDKLGFELNKEFTISTYINDSTTLKLVNPKLSPYYGYTYKKAYSKNHFVNYDTIHTTVLGINEQAKTNFIKTKVGEGNFFINTNPLAFTNYNLLHKNNYEYAFKCLSYLPIKRVIWDEHYKQKPRPSNSELRYILSQKGLRYAWYIALFTIITYLIFGAKRRQRAIPIFTAPKNTTLSFIETIGRLYFKRQNHLDMAQKKFKFFLDFLRTKYYIQTDEINEDTILQISDKCNVPVKSVKKLFSLAERLEGQYAYTEEDLERFSENIEFIYQRSQSTH